MLPSYQKFCFQVFLYFLALFATSDASGVTVDVLALLSFKSFVTDPLGVLTSWDNASNFCQWSGVACGNYNGQPRVTSLNLQSMHLAGSISPHIGNLSFLQRLHLPENNLLGPIPPELGQLPFLRHLNLSSNPLGGRVPTFLFHNCSRLQNVSLNHNSFHGVLPSNLSSCRDLRLVSLAFNMLEGPIPGDIGSLSKLQILNLQSNKLCGSIPPEIGNLALIQLTLSENALTGELPISLWNLSSLTVLRLRNNMLSGSLPQSMGESLPNLEVLLLNENHFHGRLPASLSNASNLLVIQLFSNSFSGLPPRSWGALQSLENIALANNHLEASNAEDWEFVSALGNCTSLQLLQLGVNKLGGKLPRSIGNLSTTVECLQLEYNQISGSIPSEIGNLKNLSIFYVNSNLLQGDIPVTLGNLSRMVELNLSDNTLNGEIPASLGKLSYLNKLSINLNELHGTIPLSLGNCSRLLQLDLGFNRLTGALPREVLQIPTLTFFRMQQNLLTGPLPPEVGSLWSIEELDISGNRFSGMIPSSLGVCVHLERLRAAGNLFHGPIPSSFSQLKGLQELDLSRNNFTGRIPEYFASIPFLYLNLSFNGFDGKLPLGGIFSNVSAFSVLGNGMLCGGIRQLHLPPCNLMGQISQKKKHSELILTILLTTGAICAILLCALIFFLLRHKSEKLIHCTTDTDIKHRHAKVTYAELQKTTNGFSTENLIGSGSFGSVYKGLIQWDECNLAVAIKVFNLQQRGASRSFIAECEALRNIRHRNLVGVITACSCTDFKGNAFKALIYEFMPNGNLESWLHPEIKDRSLSLAQRLNISIDVASAVDYLHNRHGHTPIVHSDLKPSNVLLDGDMTAHVGDFGLARFASKVSSRSSTSTAFNGTIGYIAPEYGVGNKVSSEGDVYSYGMLLLEMFTGKRPTDGMFTGSLSLHGYVATALPERVTEVIDPNMLAEEEDWEAVNGAVLDCLRTVLEIGISCAKQSPAERMQIEDVVNELTARRDAMKEQINCKAI